MKVVIFAGGFGTRISEESHLRPKPMVEIGEKPILWHIMKMYEFYGYNDFIICLGYKGYMIKEYFMNYFMHHSDITIDLASNSTQIHKTAVESFKVTLVETGLHTKTAGRLKRIKHHLGNEPFMLTYGDGVSDVNIENLVTHHINHGRVATMTSIQPPGRFGSLSINDNSRVEHFVEKPKGDHTWINGGFFVLQPEVFNFLPQNADDIMWEDDPLENLATSGELMAYKHSGFWKCMDHLRDKNALDQLWQSNKASWKKWK